MRLAPEIVPLVKLNGCRLLIVSVKFSVKDLTTSRHLRFSVLSRHGTIRGIKLWHSDFGIHRTRQKMSTFEFIIYVQDWQILGFKPKFNLALHSV